MKKKLDKLPRVCYTAIATSCEKRKVNSMAQSSKGGVTDKVLKQRIQRAQDVLDGKLVLDNFFVDDDKDEKFKEFRAKALEHTLQLARDAKEELKMRMIERQEKYNQWLEWNKRYQKEYKAKIRSGLIVPNTRGEREDTKKKYNSIMEEIMEPDEINKANAKEQLDRENEEALRKLEEEIANVSEEEVKRQLKAAQAYDATVESYNQRIEAAKALKDYKLVAAITLEKLAFIKANKS